MQYLVLIYSNPTMGAQHASLSEAEQEAITGEYIALAQRPEVVSSHELQPIETATTVRMDNGQTLTSDGPFAETKEVLGGYYLVQAADLDAALEFAGKIPAARMGGVVEVRPVVER